MISHALRCMLYDALDTRMFGTHVSFLEDKMTDELVFKTNYGEVRVPARVARRAHQLGDVRMLTDAVISQLERRWVYPEPEVPAELALADWSPFGGELGVPDVHALQTISCWP